MKEIWKDIEGYEGLYQISNKGRVKSLVTRTNTGRMVKRSLILRPRSNHGYLYVSLAKDKTYRNKFVHRLVGQAFVSNPENKPCINHKDENKGNNFYQNLEWVTQKENANYGTRNRRAGLGHAKAIIQYDLNWNEIKRWESASAAARYFNVEPCTISSACCKRYETSCGYKWRFESEVAT